MKQEEVQELATEYSLDVRIIQPNHYRLLNEYGKYILDVYFKKNRAGKILRNSILDWRNNSWAVIKTREELKDIILA